jgi:hypothetical protein
MTLPLTYFINSHEIIIYDLRRFDSRPLFRNNTSVWKKDLVHLVVTAFDWL